MYYDGGQVWYGPLVKLRPLRWYDRIKTGPSPEDDALLQLTREIAVRLDSRFWYRQIVWGRFVRGGVGWMITMPVISREFWLGPLGIPLAELMVPEYLKGKLSLDEWRILIEMHLLRLKAFNSGRMSRLLGVMALMILGAFGALLIVFYIFVGRPWGPILVFPAWGVPILLSLLWVRRSLRAWEFELDGNAASQFGTEQVTQVLEKMQGLNPRATLSSLADRFSVFWTPSIGKRMDELRDKRFVGPPRPSRMSKIGFRGRAIIIVLGVAIFWGSGVVAGNLYGRGQETVACLTNTCAALVIIAAVGYWSAILGGLSMIPVVLRRVRHARRKKKYQV